MCITSAIHDYGQKIAPGVWSQPSIDIFKDLVKKAEEFDILADQPHCEDPKKTAFLLDLEALKKVRDEAVGVGVKKQRDDLAAQLQKAKEEIEKRQIALEAATAEISELTQQLEDLRDLSSEADAEMSEAYAQKDAAYTERNQCVALIARMAISAGLDVAVGRTTNEQDPAWNNAVFISLPTGQVSWHFHDREAHLFEGLPFGFRDWDGHTTEHKYARVKAAFDPKRKQVELDIPNELVRKIQLGGTILGKNIAVNGAPL